MKLISMTDYVLGNQSASHYFKVTQNYAKFLKQPLELWMFVPCDENGNVLEEPMPKDSDDGNWNYQARFNQYQQAKERVLFEGFEMYCENACTNSEISVVFTKSGGILLDKNYETYVENIGHIIFIEDLTKYNLTLTQTAIKQL